CTTYCSNAPRPSRFLFTRALSPPSIRTLSLHDALPIYLQVQADPERLEGLHAAYERAAPQLDRPGSVVVGRTGRELWNQCGGDRSEEHTSELQSRENLVCRLLLEKKKK